jgi:hypothetical protein
LGATGTLLYQLDPVAEVLDLEILDGDIVNQGSRVLFHIDPGVVILSPDAGLDLTIEAIPVTVNSNAGCAND